MNLYIFLQINQLLKYTKLLWMEISLKPNKIFTMPISRVRDTVIKSGRIGREQQVRKCVW